jgi:hypothetical protein
MQKIRRIDINTTYLMKIVRNLRFVKGFDLQRLAFRFAGSRVAPATLFDASLLDFIQDRSGDPFFWPSGTAIRPSALTIG